MKSHHDFERAERPPIHLIDSEADAIFDLALAIEKKAPEVSRMLLEEVDRAEIHSAPDFPPQAARLGSEVEFLDEATGRQRRIRLVMPCEADIEAGAVSILTSVGAGLIGLSPGQSIRWPARGGAERVLSVTAVSAPAG